MSRVTIINISAYVIVFLIIWFVVWPIFADVKELRVLIQDLEIAVDQERTAIGKLEDIEEVLASYQDQVEELQLAIPSSRDIATPVAILGEASAINGLVLVSLDIIEREIDERKASKKTDSILETFDAHIGLSGRYGSFVSFLEDIESAFPLMDISDISFKILPDEFGETALINPIIDYSIILKTYYVAN